MSEKEYKKKRDFSETAEPKPGSNSKGGGKKPIFVIQKHDATSLHYDFRLEVNGTLKSWAVPKGPSTDPKIKHLAMPVEDHPMDYADFEGVIPEGNYGAGPVMVWDNGTYDNIKVVDGKLWPMEKCMKEGTVEVYLHGQKLQGGYALIKMKSGPMKDKWLLTKMKDDEADARRNPTSTENESVKTGRTLEEIAEEATTDGNGEVSDKKVKDLLGFLEKSSQKKMAKQPLPDFVPPMLASLSSDFFSHPDWIFERKLDGYRCIIRKDGDKVRLISRNNKPLSVYPELEEALEKQQGSFIADGEIVADHGNMSSFRKLQSRAQMSDPTSARKTGIKVNLYLFDLLHYEGYNLQNLPLTVRKKLLENALDFTDPIYFSVHGKEHGKDFIKTACKEGEEGLIAKRANSTYQTKRSKDWLKFKCINEQEFVIGGYTDPSGSRIGFGSLLLGYYEKGELKFAGLVGTGFTDAMLKDFKKKFTKLERKTSPFDDDVKEKNVHWLSPQLIAQVGFSEWTNTHKLRHPRFVGLRNDKDPKQIVREKPAV